MVETSLQVPDFVISAAGPIFDQERRGGLRIMQTELGSVVAGFSFAAAEEVKGELTSRYVFVASAGVLPDRTLFTAADYRRWDSPDGKPDFGPVEQSGCVIYHLHQQGFVERAMGRDYSTNYGGTDFNSLLQTNAMLGPFVSLGNAGPENDFFCDTELAAQVRQRFVSHPFNVVTKLALDACLAERSPRI